MRFSGITRTFIFLLSFAVLTLGCKPEGTDEPSASEAQLQNLTGDFKTSSSKTWSVSSVFFEGSNRSDSWSSFQLTLSTDGNNNNSYTSSGAPTDLSQPWPTSGSWTFGGTAETPDVNTLLREPGTGQELPISVTVDTGNNTMTMTFTFDENVHAGGRAEAVNGEYVFTFDGQ